MYRVLSLSGQVVSRHRTLEAAAKVVVKARAETKWGIAREGGGQRGKSLMLTKEEQRRANEILWPRLHGEVNA